MAYPRDPGLRAALSMGLRGLVPLVVLGGAVVGLLVIVQPRGDEEASVPRPAQVAAPVLLPVAPPPPEPVATATPSRSWTRPLGATAPSLVRYPDGVPPRELCSAIAEEGWAMSGWAAGEIDPNREECIGERAFGSSKAEGGAFLILRGSAKGDLREVRLRLNVLDPAKAEDAARAAGDLLRTLFDRLRWTLPPEVSDAVAARRDIALDLAGTKLRFWREPGKVARFNLSLAMPDAPGPADRFAPSEATRRAPPSLADLFGSGKPPPN